MDIFESKNIKPMLIKDMTEVFDNPDFIYELKLDGERCIAYLDSITGTDLRNKRNMRMLPKVPELSDIHKQIKKRCILDGELIVIIDGKPNFYEIQRRSLMSNTFKIKLAATKYPATFVAYDILYYDDHAVTDLPLMERKVLLEKAFSENERLAKSRYIEEKGTALYNQTVEQCLEGIVAKKKVSKYYFGKETKDWVKIKNLMDDDYVVCGYIIKENGVASIILGQFDHSDLVYKGHVTLGVSGADFDIIKSVPKINASYFKENPSDNEGAVWIEPVLVCVVEFMMYTQNGGLRQSVFKGLRMDKAPEECIVITQKT